ncbi:hypothetical protein ACFXPV_30225 [Streptomyces sp. NPDC059118]|uniref:hypothetical protein n=1 Tax=unclassified Streptomyces TaxID=2593676 RepID=UPI0036CB6CE8
MTAASATGAVGAVFRIESVSMARGPEACLALVDALAGDPALRSHHPLPGVRGDLPARTGRTDEARAESARAAGPTRNARERAMLLDRAEHPARDGR